MYVCGVGCLTCHNRSDIMRRANSNRNYYNLANDEEYRKRIASNLGDYLKGSEALSKDEILKRINTLVKNCRDKDLTNLKYKLRKWKNADKECLNSLIALAKETGIPTTRREAFYQSHLKLITYNSLDEMIKDFYALIGIPGVWEVRGCDGITYDVCQIKDIGNEMYEYLRRLEFQQRSN